MRSWITQTFSALSERPFRLIFAGSLLSTGALAASNVTRAALVWNLTESLTALALQFVAIGITMVSFSMFAGTLADRWSPKALLILSGSMFAALQAALAILVITDVIAFWQILVLSVFEGAGFAITVPARGAMIGGIVRESTRGNAVALQQVSYNAMQVVGPFMAGGLIAISVIGFGGAFITQGALYGGGVVLSMLLPNVRPPARDDARGFIAEMGDGARYIRSRPSLMIIMISTLVVSLTVFPHFVFVAGFVDVMFESDSVLLFDDQELALGVLVAISSVGAFAASIVVAGVADRERAFSLFIGTNIAFALALAVYAASPTYEVLLVVSISLGGVAAMFQSLGQSLGLRYAHRRFHGRIPAMITMLMGLTGFAALGYGRIADLEGVGLRPVLFGMSLVGLIAIGGIALYARHIDAWSDAASPGEEIELPQTSQPTAEVPVAAAAAGAD